MVSIDSWWDALVRDRPEAILELVLTNIADDYESLEIVLGSINRGKEDEDWGPESWLAKEAIPVSLPEVIEALRVLTREGYAQTYVLDTKDPQAQAVEFGETEVDDLWFYATPKGIRAVKKIYERASGTP